MRSPELSVIIPVYNEEAILEVAVRALVAKLEGLGRTFEILLCENGSVDDTAIIAQHLSRELDGVKVLRSATPNYGLALRRGIEEATGTYVICDEIDLVDIDFYTRALQCLESGVDLVIGSKRHPQSSDRRPWTRRTGTVVINGLLRLAVGFTGTDTHGLKAFRRVPLMSVVAQCTVEHDLFASELVVRAMRQGLGVLEIPLRLREIRPPSVGLLRRVPRTLHHLVKLIIAIRIKET